MNLPDIVLRKDRALSVLDGEVQPVDHRTPGGRFRAIRLTPGARILLKRADEFSAFKAFPRIPNWTVLGGDDAGGGVRVSLAPSNTNLRITLGEAPPLEDEPARQVTFDWPLSAAEGPFDLLLEQLGPSATVLSVGSLLDPRAKLRPLLHGRGLEVGPGLRPLVQPGDGVEVEYVEERSPHEWQDVYGKGRASLDALTPDILERYRVGSALTLEEWPAGGLDFIFSNHVFEHLMNPLQVLANWLGRLRPGGAIVGAVPDARFSFDLRQPFSTHREFVDERLAGGFNRPDEKYRRWCEYTAPYNTVEDLKERNYSIHVHYYTPDIFMGLVDVLVDEGLCHRAFLESAPNNKDFGFVVRKR